MNREGPQSSAHPQLAAARRFSEHTLVALGEALDALDLRTVESVAAAGSLGRLEAGPSSDCDCLIVARDDASGQQMSIEIDHILMAIEASGLRAPKATGIYREAVTQRQLLDPAARGTLDETPGIFGKRMQYLLDARPVYAPVAFSALREAILRWYLGSGGANPSRHRWRHLVHDLQRYRHSYCVWQQFKLDRSPHDSWALRQAKLRTVRLVTFAGLLCLLAEAFERDSPVAWLCEHLGLTPLERIGLTAGRQDRETFSRVSNAYSDSLSLLADPLARQELVDGGPDIESDLDERADQILYELCPSVAAVEQGVSRLLLGVQESWPPAFRAWLMT